RDVGTREASRSRHLRLAGSGCGRREGRVSRGAVGVAARRLRRRGLARATMATTSEKEVGDHTRQRLNVARDLRWCAQMPTQALQIEIERLKAQLSERDAAIVDRDARIERLAHDLAMLESHMKRLLGGRRGGYLIPEGQGVLFPNALEVTGEQDAVSDESSGEDQSDAQEGEVEDEPEPGRRKRRARRPRKVDTAGLPCEERLHELPESERVC